MKAIMKRITAIFCGATVAISMIGGISGIGCTQLSGSVEAFAEQIVTSGDYQYVEASDSYYGEERIKIVKYLGSDTKVTLPAKIDGKVVSEIGEEAFLNNTTVEEIEISEYATEYDGHGPSLESSVMFRSCTNLKKLTFPGSMGTSGSCFNHPSLEEVVFKEGIYRIGAFWDCPKLKKVTLPDGIKIVDGFDGCTSLEEISIPDSAEYVGGFSGCTALKHVKMPANLKQILDNAFYECKSLEEIEIPEGTEVIGDGAFYECEKLQTLDIPGSVTHLGAWSFQGCVGLQSVNIADSVTEIDELAFCGCSALTFVKLPENLEVLDINVFAFCRNLQSIYIPKGLITLNGSAFVDCDSLTDIYYNGTKEEWKNIVWKNTGAMGEVQHAYFDEDEQMIKFYDATIHFEASVPDYHGKTYPTNKTLPEDACVYADKKSDGNPCNGFAFYAFKASDVDVSTYADAVSYCESRGGHLATIYYSKDLENYIAEYLKNQNIKHSVYIGLSCADVSEQHWVWVDGIFRMQLDEGRWAPGEPSMDENERYATLHWDDASQSFTGWNDATFTESDKYFLCQWDDPSMDFYNSFNKDQNGNAFAHTGAKFFSKEFFEKDSALFREVAAKAANESAATPAFVNKSAFRAAQRDHANQNYENNTKLGKIVIDGETLYYRNEDSKYPTAYFGNLIKGVWNPCEQNELREKKNKKWGGSCFGIEATLILAKEGAFDNMFFNTDITEMGYPVENRYGFRDVINYYQLKQYRWEVKPDHRISKTDSDEEKKQFNRAIVKEAKYAAQHDKNFILGYYYDRTNEETGKITESGHAVIVCGYSFDGKNHCIRIYDCNTQRGSYKYLYISSDYSSITYTGRSDIKKMEYYGADKVLSWANDLTGSKSVKAASEGEATEVASIQELANEDGRSVITFSANTSFTMTNDAGESINVSGGDVSGNLSIYGEYSAVTNEDQPVDISLVVDESSSYTISNIGTTSEDSPFRLSASLSGNAEYCSVMADGASQVQISEADGVSLQGTAYSFTVTESVADADALCSLSGTATDAVMADLAGSTMHVQSAEPIKDITVGAYGSEGALSEYTVADGSDIRVPVKSAAEVDVQWDIQNAEVSGLAERVFNEKAQTQEPMVTMAEDGVKKTLIEDVDYTVSYRNNINVGTATVTIAGKGDYTGTITKDFRILFKDVDEENAFFSEIYWMVDDGLTTGFDDGTYRPWNSVNRAAVVTFLWRMAGEPEPAEMATYKDMPTNKEDFMKAISWAAEKGITTGYKDGSFKPWAKCNRAAIVTFLWRYKGKPSATESASFSDMTGNSDFDAAIAWASENGITNGWSDNTFRPWNDCNRAAMAAFLNRCESN